MDFFSFLTFLGGIALFLFGMHYLGDAIGKIAGGRFKTVLQNLTASPVKGVIVGTLVTAVIQSSSATIVMVLGFINSGIMTLQSSIGIIMGANIGTTATAWILSLSDVQGTSFWLKLINPDSFVPILAFVGCLLLLFTKSERKKDIGSILLGFAILMFGMDTMSGAMQPLANDPDFAKILTLFSNPILGVLTGFVMTAIIQSSSASVGILQAMSVTGGITYGNAIPIIMGQNIGACVIVLISSIGSNRDARRAAWVHLYFNIIGTLVFLILFYLCDYIFDFAFVAQSVNSVNIAIIHSTFKLASTVVLLPFTKQLIALSRLTVKSSPEEQKFQMLDEHFLATPPIAVARCREMTDDMALLSKKALFSALDMIDAYSEEAADEVLKIEDEVDTYEDRLGTYMVKLSACSLTVADSHEVSKLLHCIGDFERISDHAVNIMRSGKELTEKGLHFSYHATAELAIVDRALHEILEMAVTAFVNNDLEMAFRVEPLEQVIDFLVAQLKARHIERLQRGECTTELGFVFSDLITNYERLADHCSNIAVCVIEISKNAFDTHEYLNSVKNSNNAGFQELYQEYMEKYHIG